jgi:glycosyltransferase involved in cell wall biosynthesis
MKIGYDAKRAYHNTTGLGNYSRLLVESMARFYPGNQYLLFVARVTGLFKLPADNVKNVVPVNALDKIFASNWRSVRVKKQILDHKIDIYHGLSNEIPVNLYKSEVKTVVTIHDLIYERYPGQYNPVDVRTYRAKAKYACRYAKRIIAASEQTKQDIIHYYKIDGEKIDVCYQACNPAFSEDITEQQKEMVISKYGLPPRFFLSVGSVIERKNLLSVCKAIKLLEHDLDIPLVVIGNGGAYKKKVKEYIAANNLEQRIIFLSDSAAASGNDLDLPGIYRCATALIYPSFFEGFGIPVLEALCSGLPVITSKSSCLPEVGGDAAFYVEPGSPEEIAGAMKRIATEKELVETMRTKGWQQSQNFTPKECASAVMEVYKNL